MKLTIEGDTNDIATVTRYVAGRIAKGYTVGGYIHKGARVYWDVQE